MIAIKGIKMPSCCYACQLFKFSICNEPYCVVEIRPVDLSRFERPDWRPLAEVKEKADDAVPVGRKKGKWIEDGYRNLPTVCPYCGERGKRSWNYCPNCGADMKGESNGSEIA